jgi:uncharacterized caspase-like protein
MIFALDAPANAETRVALVIGNAAYQNTAALANPEHDAEDMAAALTRVGFSVVLERNLDKRGMEPTRRCSITPVTACRTAGSTT